MLCYSKLLIPRRLLSKCSIVCRSYARQVLRHHKRFPFSSKSSLVIDTRNDTFSDIKVGTVNICDIEYFLGIGKYICNAIDKYDVNASL